LTNQRGDERSVAHIQIENRDRVVILKLCRGSTNPLNLELVRELTDCIRRAKEDPGIRGLVLASSNEKFFSIGFDLPELLEASKEEFTAFYRAFDLLCIDLYGMPKPTAAGITGHAVAGGCILAICCDYRVIAEGRRLMGVNEVKLGVPVPYPGERILIDMLCGADAREVIGTGEFYEPEKCLEMGMVDEVVPVDHVLARAVKRVSTLGALPAGAFRAVKLDRTEPVVEEIEKRLAEKEKSFMECWYSAEARKRLQEARKKF
jgi:enoyl-CoA hydratase/carnithine racemase